MSINSHISYITHVTHYNCSRRPLTVVFDLLMKVFQITNMHCPTLVDSGLKTSPVSDGAGRHRQVRRGALGQKCVRQTILVNDILDGHHCCSRFDPFLVDKESAQLSMSKVIWICLFALQADSPIWNRITCN